MRDHKLRSGSLIGQPHFFSLVNPFWPWARIIYDSVNCIVWSPYYGQTHICMFPNILAVTFWVPSLNSIATPLYVSIQHQRKMSKQKQKKEEYLNDTRNSCKWRSINEISSEIRICENSNVAVVAILLISNIKQSSKSRHKRLK